MDVKVCAIHKIRFLISNRDKRTNEYFFDSETLKFIERDPKDRLCPVSVLGSGLRDRDRQCQNRDGGRVACARVYVPRVVGRVRDFVFVVPRHSQPRIEGPGVKEVSVVRERPVRLSYLDPRRLRPFGPRKPFTGPDSHPIGSSWREFLP